MFAADRVDPVEPAAAAGGPAVQLTLARMPARLFPCTPSRLAAFDCPRRYRFTYLERPIPPRGPAWAHNTVGAVAHLALHRWWSLPRAHRTPDEGASLVERNWQHNGFRDDRQSLRSCTTTAGWVREYLADVDPTREPVGVERTVAARTERLAVSGRVDRVDERSSSTGQDGDERSSSTGQDGDERSSSTGQDGDERSSSTGQDGDERSSSTGAGQPGELVVIDYKTGRRPLDVGDARGSQALALYVLGVRRTLRRACRRVELHHLPTGTVSAFEHTDESLGRHLARAEATAADIVTATDTLAAGADPDDVFPPVLSPACAWCDFRQHCPEGRDSSPSLTPWAGLPDAPA